MAVRPGKPLIDLARYDLAIAADMTIGAGTGYRIATEAAAHAEAGYQVALVHLPTARSSRRISPDIQACVASGLCDPVDPVRGVTADCVTIYSDHVFVEMPARLQGLRADVAKAVVGGEPDFDVERADSWLTQLYAQLAWSPVDADTRKMLDKRHKGLALTKTDYPMFRRKRRSRGPDALGRRLRIGQIGRDGGWPETLDEMLALYPTDGSMEVRFLGIPPMRYRRIPNAWQALDPDAKSVERFLDGIDVLMHYPEEAHPSDLAVIAGMLERGKPVFTRPGFKRDFGTGPVYADDRNAASVLGEYLLDPVIRQQVDRVALEGGERLTRTVAPRGVSKAGPARVAPGRRNVLFLASNGTGLGHVTTLLAVARRATAFEPVFVTMAQAVDAIESFGFVAEHLPTAHYLGTDFDDWDGWFQVELEQIIDWTNAAAVVYDGNGPSPGLVRAAGSRGCGLVWIKSGLPGDATFPFRENEAYFDVVVEPGELAGGFDDDDKPETPDPALLPSPILLLDREELLTRKDAAAAIGFDPAKPAVLIQLGSGSNRDIVGLIDRCVKELAGFPEVQIALVEWTVGVPLPALWPHITVVRGFPLAQYYQAFDFTISASGYNTFHEIVAYGIPTIFIANTHPSMDDQSGRARFAEAHELAVELNDHDLRDLPLAIRTMMSPDARAVIRSNCERLGLQNGAGRVATAIAGAFGFGANE